MEQERNKEADKQRALCYATEKEWLVRPASNEASPEQWDFNKAEIPGAISGL
jgi:hypothetical protein